MIESERLKYTLEEIENLIEETSMQIEVVKKTYAKDVDTMISKTNVLERKIRKLKTSKQKPYFARIDFKNTKENLTDICYIGKTGIINNDDQIVTVDWRAPISSLYYDSNIGLCTYNSVEGDIEGELLLKRQFDIENSVLKSYSDVDTVSNDEILKPYLSVNSDKRLKNIISTIQSEQNKIIREKLEKNIIVQGVAGSGKTTVALHRIAYLVYNYRDYIENNQYMVIGPNKFFIKYISNILPDLDVDGVRQFDFIEFINDYLDENIKLEDSIDSKTTKIKTSMYYKDLLDKYINDLEKEIVPNDDLQMYGFKILDRKIISDIFNSIEGNYTDLVSKVDKCSLLVQRKIYEIQDKIITNLHNYINDEYENNNNTKIVNNGKLIKNEIENNCRNLLNNYFKFVNDNIKTLYFNFLKNINKYEKDENILKLLDTNSKKIKYDDLISLVYLKYKIKGNINYNKYRQVVIDEAQDYNEFVFYTIGKIFKNANFSIFGDLAQSIFKYRNIEDWSNVNNSIKNIEIINLSKSYRTTIEIMNEANKINTYLKLNKAVPVIRHGKNVEYVKINNYLDILDKINMLKEKNYNTIAIISKNSDISNDIYNKLKKHIDIMNINENLNEYNDGIYTVTSELSKGLEFDAVIINDVSEDVFNINIENDMKLLYVSMTRAMHELIITYTKELTKVLN